MHRRGTGRLRALCLLAAGLASAGLAGCERAETPVLSSLAPLPPGADTPVPPRVNGAVGSTDSTPAPQISLGRGPAPLNVPPAPGLVGGDISLDFADTDLRDVVAQILGAILRVNYTVDPAVRGAVTLHTANPIARSQLIPTLQALLAQNGAALTVSNGLYRVLPAAVAAATVPSISTDPLTGGTVVGLRFASAEDLARVLQPYVGNGGRVVADPGRNAVLVSGEPASREALVSLIRAFDVDALAGQSYALFPVGTGSAKDFAGALAEAFRSQAGGSLAGVVRIVPMERIGSVLLVSSQPRYIDEARRVFGLVDRARRQSIRTWHVYYLQNGRSNDIAYVLQQAFTPNRVTAQPSSRALGATAPGRGQNTVGSGFNNGGGGLGGGGGGIGGGGLGGGGLGGGGLGGGGLGGGLNSGGGINGGIGATGAAGGLGTQTNLGAQPQDPASNPANPLFGGLDPNGGGAGSGAPGAGNGGDVNALRIIPNPQNNALLVYATPQEIDTVEGMLRKIDILPLQVRIDATIAEVTLNDQLQYGTQFFFKAGGINGELSFLAPPVGAAAAAQSFANGFPGFLLSGPNNGNAALNALQSVTNVKVLSSPQVMVLDNEAARLQVGALVPYLTSSSQSQLAANAPIVNSVNYRETGVILDVTPRVNSGGLVTLDISQEVSALDTATTIVGINSPVFSERNVTSRVVVQDGQTIGLAGLIQDSSSRQNSGIPFLKDIPLLGLLAGSQVNNRARTELLVLITPHVVHDQRDARALTEDLRDNISHAATVPDDLQRLQPTGSPDPSRPLRRALRLDR